MKVEDCPPAMLVGRAEVSKANSAELFAANEAAGTVSVVVDGLVSVNLIVVVAFTTVLANVTGEVLEGGTVMVPLAAW